jgi:hypothetical protein
LFVARIQVHRSQEKIRLDEAKQGAGVAKLPRRLEKSTGSKRSQFMVSSSSIVGLRQKCEIARLADKHVKGIETLGPPLSPAPARRE